MPPAPTFHPASRHSLQQLAAFFTAAFEGYVFPVTTDAEQLAKRTREEALDLHVSQVMALSGYPAGLFLLARREQDAWCGGFGINKPQRGKGYAKALAAEMVERARASGARQFRLEVLKANEPARICYEKCGFEVLRELLLFSWKPQTRAIPTSDGSRPVSLEASSVLKRLSAARTPRPCWQRTPASLLAKSDLEAFSLPEGDGAVALGVRRSDGTFRIYDFSEAAPDSVPPLLRGLQHLFPQGLTLYNESADSPYLEPLLSAGFKEVERQYEMHLELAPS